MPAENIGTGCLAGVCASLIAACLGSGLAGCGSGEPTPDTGVARERPTTVRESPPHGMYRIPRPAGACEAVRVSGIALSAVTPVRAVDHRSGCRVELGTDPKAHSYTLHVRFLDELTPSRATTTYNLLKDADWNHAHSPFSGRCSERKEVGGIGTASVGREYDAGYYAYFPSVVVAGVPYSQSVVVLRRGNVLLEFDLLGGERTGRSGVYMRPAPPEIAKKALDDTADELLSLITPA